MGRVPDIIPRTIQRFGRNIDAYRSGRYNEAQPRREFADRPFKALGWKVCWTARFARRRAAGHGNARNELENQGNVPMFPLYEYVRSTPVAGFDPQGLCSPKGAIRTIGMAKVCCLFLVRRGVRCFVCSCGFTGEPFLVYATKWGRCGGSAPSCPAPNLRSVSCCQYMWYPKLETCIDCANDLIKGLPPSQEQADFYRAMLEHCMSKYAPNP